MKNEHIQMNIVSVEVIAYTKSSIINLIVIIWINFIIIKCPHLSMRVVEFASYDFYFYRIYFTRQPSPVFRLS
ncbi:TPA: hypothetical protein RPV57_001840, partial [Campylobacter fetus]|uniref:hypothetical protein n=2 Tax=Campylobacter fetus TaxID=196 RepID=UPI0028924AFF|nr:hypothetical protein [Campylobacter fetus]HEG6044004.1 hypothetical protein [Campylobacter fetus]